jgi:hypothetical protein
MHRHTDIRTYDETHRHTLMRAHMDTLIQRAFPPHTHTNIHNHEYEHTYTHTNRTAHISASTVLSVCLATVHVMATACYSASHATAAHHTSPTHVITSTQLRHVIQQLQRVQVQAGTVTHTSGSLHGAMLRACTCNSVMEMAHTSTASKLVDANMHAS